ncbi:MAG: PQQ-binding-like beta-propeller repeat protein [Planctomycetota bacterium]|nr:PQQ-binding-like beta-propeller repeat protein [Planctomycetota bacterium]
MTARIREGGQPGMGEGDPGPQGVRCARPAAKPWIGVVCGTLLLLTVVIPWGVSGEHVVWSWHMLHRWPVTAVVMLLGVWSAGLVTLAAGISLRGVKLAIAYLVAGGAALTLYLVATEASPIPWRVFVPGATQEVWLQPMAVASLALYLVVTGVRAQGNANVPLCVLQCLTSLIIAGVAISGGADAVRKLGAAADYWLVAAVGLTAAALIGLGGLLTLLQSLSFESRGHRLTRAGRRLVLASLLLSLVWGIVGPVVASPAITIQEFSCVPERLTGAILLAGIPLVTIEGLIGVCTRFGYAMLGAVAVTISGVAVVVSLQQGYITPAAQQLGAIPQRADTVAVHRRGDWVQWCGRPDRNMVCDEEGLPERFDHVTKEKTSGLTNIKWVVRLGTYVFGSPVIAGGMVFIGGMANTPGTSDRAGMLWCFREADGKLLWRLRAPHITSLYGNDSYGICSTPTVEGDHAYLLGNLGDVLCLSTNGMAGGSHGPFGGEAQRFGSGRELVTSQIAPDGTRILECTAGTYATLGPLDADVLWTFDTLREANCWPFNALNAAILIRGNRLYVATCSTFSDHSDGSQGPIEAWKKKYQKTRYDSPSLIVLDKSTGKLLARDTEGVFEQTFHGAHSSPALGTVNGKELLFYGGGNGTCYAFDPDFVPGPDGKPGQLKLVWKFDCLAPSSYGSSFRPDRLYKAETIATPVFYKNRIYTSIGNDLINSGPTAGPGRLVCIDATQTGDITRTGRIWSFDDMCSCASTVAIADGLLYTADAGGTIYCLDADTGAVCWTHKTAPVWSSPLVADGKVYVGTHGRGLLVFAHGRTKTLLSQNMTGGDIVASPAAARGVLYVASQRHLYALERGKTGALVEHGE